MPSAPHTALSRALERWSLTSPALVAETPTSLVYKVERPDHSPAALKLLKPGIGDDEIRGGAMLAWYGGSGAAAVLGLTDDAVLMQRLAGESLGDLARSGNDPAATDILCAVVARLHAPRQAPPPHLVPLRQRFDALFSTPAAAWPPQAHEPVARATAIAHGLLDQPAPELPVHGDIHHDNILRSADGWVVIDPKGLIGDPAHDYANSFQNPERAAALVLGPSRIERHAAAISNRTGIARKYLLAWAVAHTALSAAWHIEDGNPPTHQVNLLPLLLAVYDAA